MYVRHATHPTTASRHRGRRQAGRHSVVVVVVVVVCRVCHALLPVASSHGGGGNSGNDWKGWLDGCGRDVADSRTSCIDCIIDGPAGRIVTASPHRRQSCLPQRPNAQRPDQRPAQPASEE
ncbi:hypothetical protein BZA05DRAFT_386839 [Tricharina praecox]|uniref:uncharacterized protein n=1 Tax=Tricharina praecox TaxID=43433 RepID=UPI00221EABE7|nr:uncharacterized protein BZA05DRAFT_386839 [Tricharina praecox]KAI5856975.1 hypothetical protein BZA05DRAFT_386839 [Tricharina praecox]